MKSKKAQIQPELMQPQFPPQTNVVPIKKKSRWWIGVIVGIGILIVVAVALYFIFFQSSLKNCKEDRHCIVVSIRECVEAKGTVIVDGAGNPSKETYFEVRGNKGGQCEIYIKNLDDKEMTCSVSYAIYEGTDYGGYGTRLGPNDIRASTLDDCNGNLKDYIELQYLKYLKSNPNAIRDNVGLGYY